MEPIRLSTDPVYNQELSNFNNEQDQLRTGRTYCAVGAFFVGGGVAAAFTLRSFPPIRIAAISCGSLIAIFCFKKYLGISESKIIDYPANSPRETNTIALIPSDREIALYTKKTARLILTFIALGSIAVVGLLFKFHAPKPIKIVAVVLSAAIFSIYFRRLPYIQLTSSGENSPDSSGQSFRADSNGLRRAASALLLPNIAEQQPSMGNGRLVGRSQSVPLLPANDFIAIQIDGPPSREHSDDQQAAFLATLPQDIPEELFEDQPFEPSMNDSVYLDASDVGRFPLTATPPPHSDGFTPNSTSTPASGAEEGALPAQAPSSGPPRFPHLDELTEQ